MSRLTRHPTPEYCPGAYVFYAYCAWINPEHPWSRGPYMVEADQVETRGQAKAQLRKAGWVFHKDGTATCPKCAPLVGVR